MLSSRVALESKSTSTRCCSEAVIPGEAEDRGRRKKKRKKNGGGKKSRREEFPPSFAQPSSTLSVYNPAWKGKWQMRGAVFALTPLHPPAFMPRQPAPLGGRWGSAGFCLPAPRHLPPPGNGGALRGELGTTLISCAASRYRRNTPVEKETYPGAGPRLQQCQSEQPPSAGRGTDNELYGLTAEPRPIPLKVSCLLAAPPRCLTLPGRRRRSPQSLRGEARPAPLSGRGLRPHLGPSVSPAGRAPPRTPGPPAPPPPQKRHHPPATPTKVERGAAGGEAPPRRLQLRRHPAPLRGREGGGGPSPRRGKALPPILRLPP